jgi:HD-like signal output (HDOD) protein
MSATIAATDPLEVWLDRLRNQDMPIFGATLAAIGEVAEDDASPTSALGRIVLRDAGMTSRVLRMANSVFFRGEGSRISTISRAIVVLGFDTVRNVAVSVALIDAFLSGGVRERVSAEMARCFHAAVHARHAATVRGDPSPEEVFIATLLSRIGELAFWCFAGDTGHKLDLALRQSSAPPEKVEADILGFRLRSLTQALAREWSLPGLVINACADSARPDSREALVLAGYRLAGAAEAGWSGEAARDAVRDYARLLRQDVASVAPVVAQHAGDAARIAGFYGCDDAASRIPVPPPTALADDGEAAGGGSEPDPAAQLDHSRRMVALISARSASGGVLDLALAAAGTTLGADRAVLALVGANRTQLSARATHGHGAQQMMRHFNFLLAGAARDALTELVDHGRIIDITATHVPAPGLPSVTRLRTALGERHQLFVPITAREQVVGVLYVDRAPTRPPLPADTPDALLHFARLAGIALESSPRAR